MGSSRALAPRATARKGRRQGLPGRVMWVARRANMLYLAARTRNRAVVRPNAAHIAALRKFWADWPPWHGNTHRSLWPSERTAWDPRQETRATWKRVPCRRRGQALRCEPWALSSACAPGPSFFSARFPSSYYSCIIKHSTIRNLCI